MRSKRLQHVPMTAINPQCPEHGCRHCNDVHLALVEIDEEGQILGVGRGAVAARTAAVLTGGARGWEFL